jgi:DNA topoisomerase-1
MKVPERNKNVWVTFPSPVKPSLSSLRITVNGKNITSKLSPKARFFANKYACLSSEHKRDKTFANNFWKDWQLLIPTSLRHHSFSAFRFTSGCEKAPRSSTKTNESCKVTLSGKRHPIVGCRTEPEAIFLGRGSHPTRGRIKRAIVPEDVTINHLPGTNAPPLPPTGHKWKSVIRKPSDDWLASWKDPLSNKRKYVRLAPDTADVRQKFDHAYELAKVRPILVKLIRKLIHSSEPRDQDTGIVLFLLDRLAIRVGGNSAAGTVGLTTLKRKHIKLNLDKTMSLDFLGKDSIRYTRDHESIPLTIYKLLNTRLNTIKDPNGFVFDHTSAAIVNSELKTLLPKQRLTAKTFRTYHANRVFQEVLDKHEKHKTISHPKSVIMEARMAAALLCNHVRSGKPEIRTAIKNYLDPRLTVAFAKRQKLDPMYFFSSAEASNFNWAKTTPLSFRL